MEKKNRVPFFAKHSPTFKTFNDIFVVLSIVTIKILRNFAPDRSLSY